MFWSVLEMRAEYTWLEHLIYEGLKQKECPDGRAESWVWEETQVREATGT